VLTAEGRELSFAHAEPGAIFGEIAMLDGGPRSADATAVNKVTALSLSKPALKRLMDTRPLVGEAALRFLCSRLREADQQLEAIALYPIEGGAAFRAAANRGTEEGRDIELPMSQRAARSSEPPSQYCLSVLRRAPWSAAERIICDLEAARSPAPTELTSNASFLAAQPD
jgi:CRP-like cAMP-binding protein